MNKPNLENLSKSELIELVKKLQKNNPIPKPRTMKPIAAPRRSVKQMVQSYEDNIILPPPEFRDDHKPTPAPRKLKNFKPVPLTRTKIEETNKALKGYTKSYEINIKFKKDPLRQLQSTRSAIEFHIKKSFRCNERIEVE